MNKIVSAPGSGGLRLAGGPAAGAVNRIAIVMPVLDDWQAFALLIRRIAECVAHESAWTEIVAIDDGSAERFDPATIPLPPGVDVIRVIHLALNLGHQRAIAVGLVHLSARQDLDAVIVMDSDGEDRPEEIPDLLTAARAGPGQAVLAYRGKRSESLMFRVGYAAYRFFFRVLTGQGISFGNFSLLPIAAVRRLVHMPELWNNLPAAIIRSRMRFVGVHTVRGARLAGRSRMNFPALAVHGLSAMSVYADFIFVRVLLGAGAVSLASLLAICAVLTVRFGTGLAIPGWATTVFGDLVIILFQAVLMIVATSLIVLAGRSARPILPLTDAPVYIQTISETRDETASSGLRALAE